MLKPPRVFSRQFIRQYAEHHFSISGHTQSYLQKYNDVMAGKNLNAKAPQWSLAQKAQDLLPF
jgi:hypothetical protein